MTIIRDDPSWSKRQKDYAGLVRKKPQEAFERFRSGVSSPLADGRDSRATTLDEDALMQLVVLHSFFRDQNVKTDAYGSILHIVGTEFWESCLRSELPFVLVNIVASADFSATGGWTPETLQALHVLRGFVNLWWFDIELPWIKGAAPRASIPASQFVSVFFERCGDICSHVWRHRAALVDLGGIEDISNYEGVNVLRDIAQIVVHMSHKRFGVPPAMLRSSKLPNFLLWSWSFLPFAPGIQVDNRALDAFMSVYMTANTGEKRAWMEDLVVNDVGAEKVLSKLATSILDNGSIVSDILGNSLAAFDIIASWDHPDMARALAQMPTVAILASTLKKKDPSSRAQLIGQPDSSWAHMRLKIWVSCAHLLELVASGLASGITDSRTVSGDDVYSIFAHGMLLALDILRAEEAETFLHYEKFYWSSLSSWSDHLRNNDRDKSAFPTTVVKSLRKAAGSGWYGLLLEMRKTTNAPAYTPRLIEEWLDLGLALGFDEEKKRREYDTMLSHICHWSLCQYHLSPAKDALKTCKGCGVAHYCSSECQVSDWKKGGHKTVCRRLKA